MRRTTFLHPDCKKIREREHKYEQTFDRKVDTFVIALACAEKSVRLFNSCDPETKENCIWTQREKITETTFVGDMVMGV